MPRDGRFAGEGGDNGTAAQHQIAATETGYVGIGEHRRGVKPDGLAKRIAERQRQAGEFLPPARGAGREAALAVPERPGHRLMQCATGCRQRTLAGKLLQQR